MMKKLYIKTITPVLMALALASCNDFLEPKANNEFVPKDANSLNEILLGEAYPRPTGNAYFEAFTHLFDDDVAMAPYQEPQTGFDPMTYFIPFTWQPDIWEQLDRYVPAKDYNMYFYYYQHILGCNAIIDYIDQASGDTRENIDNVLAQAYTLRGFYYLQLVNIFGEPYTHNPNGLGVPLKLTSSIEDKPLRRNTVAEVYDRIVNDLTTAIELYSHLPASRQWTTDYRTSLPMAQLILSRAYLYMERWKDAAKYAKMVMENPNFSLVNLYLTETIEKIDLPTPTYVDFNNYSSTECIWPYGRVTDTCLWLTEYTKLTNPTRYIHSYFMASPDLMNTFEEKDLRKICYVITSWYNINGERMPQPIGKINVNDYYVASGGVTVFGRALRLAEAYINYAEAQANIPGGETEAIKALDELRKNRFSPEDYASLGSMDTDALKQFVRDERRREMCFEGQRWFDLRRWGMPEIKHIWYADAETTMEYVLQAGDNQYTLPLPIFALEANPELVQSPLAPAPRNGQQIEL